jgi:GNAT superfamily N-acetyltransferase
MMRLPPGLAMEIEDQPAEADVEILPHALEAFNEQCWPEHQQWHPLGVFVRDAARIVAGLAGETYAGWLFVRYLWVSGELRGHGLGSALLRAGEIRAAERGCHSAFLDTFSFQAPDFYRKLGYEVFGELAWSTEHRRIFLRKSLTQGANDRSAHENR